MEYDYKKDEQAAETSARFSIPGTGQGRRTPNIVNPFRIKGKPETEKESEGKQPEEKLVSMGKRKVRKKEEPIQEAPLPAPGPDRITITMLGISGSGKTMFLSGVYQSLIQESCCGVSLMGDDARMTADSPLKVTGQIAEIALINRDHWSFPVGTNRTVEYPLRLFYHEEEVCGFDFLDYAGGQLSNLLKLPEESLNADQTKLRDQLKKSDELMIFADADVLARYDVLGSSDDLTLCRQEIGAATVYELFNDLKDSYQDRAMTVLIVLTKIDKVPRYLCERNYAELVRRAKKVYENLWATLAAKSRAEENPWNIGIIPVTAVGMHNEVKHVKITEERDGIPVTIEGDYALYVPKPKNMDAAMVYSVAAILKQRCQSLARQERDLVAECFCGDPAREKAAKARSVQLKSLRIRLEGYVTSLTMNTGTVPQILERKDVLGW